MFCKEMLIKYVTRHNQDLIMINIWCGQDRMLSDPIFNDDVISFISEELVTAASQRGNTMAVMLQNCAQKRTSNLMFDLILTLNKPHGSKPCLFNQKTGPLMKACNGQEHVTHCKRITFGFVHFLAFLEECRFPLNQLSTSLNGIHIHVCIRIGTIRNTQIQIHANMLKNHFPLNIVQAKNNTCTLTLSDDESIGFASGNSLSFGG